MQEMADVLVEVQLKAQLDALARCYFPRMNSIPALEVKEPSGDGPAWLDATTGTIYIDKRVSTFQEKTTRILILHELIHWSLYLDNVSDPSDEKSDQFLGELSRIKRLGAYNGLL